MIESLTEATAFVAACSSLVGGIAYFFSLPSNRTKILEIEKKELDIIKSRYEIEAIIKESGLAREKYDLVRSVIGEESGTIFEKIFNVYFQLKFSDMLSAVIPGFLTMMIAGISAALGPFPTKELLFVAFAFLIYYTFTLFVIKLSSGRLNSFGLRFIFGWFLYIVATTLSFLLSYAALNAYF